MSRVRPEKQISKLASNFGLQYDILLNGKTYFDFRRRPINRRVNLRPNMTRVIYSTNIGSAAVVDSVGKENFYLPHMYNLGLSFSVDAVQCVGGLFFPIVEWIPKCG